MRSLTSPVPPHAHGMAKAARTVWARAAAAASAPPAAICVSSRRRAGCAPPDVHVSQLRGIEG